MNSPDPAVAEATIVFEFTYISTGTTCTLWLTDLPPLITDYISQKIRKQLTFLLCKLSSMDARVMSRKLRYQKTVLEEDEDNVDDDA